jgi:hypothetical protein
MVAIFSAALRDARDHSFSAATSGPLANAETVQNGGDARFREV